MDKHYLLLRNNQQKGPFTLEELVQLGLKPDDLIWMEGKSSSWLYPSEIAMLKPYVAVTETTNKRAVTPKNDSGIPGRSEQKSDSKTTGSTPAATAKHIFVSLPTAASGSLEVTPKETPVKSLEQKAEELKKKVETYALKHPQTTTENELPNYVPRSLDDLQKDYSSWLHKQQKVKKRSHVKKNSIVTIITVLIVGVGYVLAKDTILTKRAVAELTVANQLHSEAGKTAKRKHPKAETVREYTPPALVDYNQPDSQTIDSKGSILNYKKGAPPSRSVAIKIPVPAITDVEKDMEASLPPLAKDKGDEPTNHNENISSINEEAKSDNTFGHKISTFFSKLKHKKQEEKSPEKATAGTNLSDKAAITVAPYKNAATGIHGLKVTFHNSAGGAIKKGVVELRYYDTSNNVIDKKWVDFTNVSPGSSATETVPDNPLSDHTSYQLLSVDN